ncbi:hypothetical protein PR048_012674 [Dryococelus australis]|uniref:Reverse transcriptase domain-containing protein n=1 Tax=Dryococelus australis TaxID=614101 RepID=A0ABQ9HRG9_9NEOP|nr:hypothetical protein PR048_012674 [Dryococelus australis]
MEENEERNIKRAAVKYMRNNTWEDVEEALKRMKNEKSFGAVECRIVECSRVSGTAVAEKIPEDWKKGLTVSFFKKEDKIKCSNYKRVTVLGSAQSQLLFTVVMDEIIREVAGKTGEGRMTTMLFAGDIMMWGNSHRQNLRIRVPILT